MTSNNNNNNNINKCIHCGSKNITNWGFLRNGVPRWKCEKAGCGRTFSSNSGLPPTTIPPKFIAHILYMYRANSKKPSAKRMVNYTNHWLGIFPFKKKKITLFTFYRWKRLYLDSLLGKITKKEAQEYFYSFLDEFTKGKQIIEQIKSSEDDAQTIWVSHPLGTKTRCKKGKYYLSHLEFLQHLINEFGKPNILKIMSGFEEALASGEDLLIKKHADVVTVEKFKWKNRRDRTELYRKWKNDEDAKMILSKDRNVYVKEVRYSLRSKQAATVHIPDKPDLN